jgi:crossover junction endodeoxyribonuclease RuvC
MIILGLDLSLSSTGWNIITHEDTILGHGRICTNAKKHTEFERMYIVAKEIKELIEVNSIEVVVVEDQFFAKNPKTGLTLARLMGCIIYICKELEVSIELLTPTQARKILLGVGKSTKEDVAKFIRENYIDIGEFSDKNGKDKTSDIYDSFVVSLAWNKKNNLNNKYGNNK